MPLAAVSARAQKVQYSSKHRESEQALPLSVTGGTAKLRAKVAAGKGVSLVVADFDSDGTQDIIAGYATSTGGALLLQRGSPLALAPTPHEWAMQAAGELVAPYVAKAEPIELPVRPDLLKSADIHGYGFSDLIAAQKGDTSLYLALGDGRGNFATATAVPLAGRISSLATWQAASGDNLVVAGVCGSQGCGLQFLDRDGKTKAFVATPGAVTAIETGSIDVGIRLDLALIAGGKVLVLDGDTALSAKPTLETLPVSGAVALALGTFVPDHHAGLQIAVLDAGATLHVITRQGIDASYDPERRKAQIRATAARLAAKSYTPPHITAEPKRTGLPWTEAETVQNVGSGGEAIMFRARLSGGGDDDLAIMGGTQYVTVAHPLVREGALFKVTPVVTIDSTSSPVSFALPARISADARHGVVAMGAAVGAHPLTLGVPASYRTMTVNTITDAIPTTALKNLCINGSAGCELRSAITVADLDRSSTTETKVDTINVNAGTYVLSAVNVDSGGTTQTYDFDGSYNVHLELDASINLVGAVGTIINANHVDMAIAVNYGSFYATQTDDFEAIPTDAFISTMTIENGTNPNTDGSGNCGNGYCNFHGGNVTWEVEGASNLVMTGVTITGGTNGQGGGGGGIYISYDASSSGTAGPLEIDLSTISSNKLTLTDTEGGGGIDNSVENGAAYNTPMILTSDIITGNTASGEGGGVLVEGTSGQITITNSTISSNTAHDANSDALSTGGGMWINAPLTMSGTIVSANGAGPFGGGAYLFENNYTNTVTTSTFTTNSLTETESGYTNSSDGAGICLSSADTAGQGVYSVKYSRFHGNTGGHSTGLAVGCASSGTSYATVTATDDWWGCNPTTAANLASGDTYAISGAGCDSAGMGNVTNGSITVLPYTKLTLVATPSTLEIGQTVVATVSLGQDSNGTIFSVANDQAFLSAPITTFSLTDTGTVTYNPSSTALSNTAATGTSYAAATETATANGTGNGTATVNVDGQTLTASYTVTAPDLTVTSAHSGNFKAGDSADYYTLTVSNIGTGSTSGTVNVVDTVPSGFTATAIAGSGWTCTMSSVSCTRSDSLAASGSYAPVIVTVSVSASDVGTYTNSATVSGGGETNTGNDTGTDSTLVIAPPSYTMAFSPASTTPNTTVMLTYTISNPNSSTTLTGLAFTNTLPSSLKLGNPASPAQTACGGTLGAMAGGTSVTLTSGSVSGGGNCNVVVYIVAPAAIGTYPDTSGMVTATNSNAGATASATLTVAVTPTKVAFTTAPATPITAGGNAGSVQVALEDGSGNIATNNSSTSVTLAVSGPSGYIQSSSVTASNGVATFNLSSISLTLAGTYTYTATAASLTQAQSTETVNTAALSGLAVSGYPTSNSVQLAGTATVRAVDQYGNTITGFTGTVTVTSSDAAATISPASYTYTSSDAGSHAFTVTFNTAGTQNITATSGGTAGSEVGLVVGDAIWVLAATGQRTEITEAGATLTSATGTSGTASTYGALAVDGSGNIWSVASITNALAYNTYTGGSATTYTGGGLSTPVGVAIDGLGQVWVANSGAGTVSAFSTDGAALSPASGFSTNGTGGSGIAIDISGSVWVANGTSNTVTRILGAAAPVVSPISTAIQNVTLGSRP